MISNIIEQTKLYDILCVKVRDAHSNKIVWRARGKILKTYITPMESKVEDFGTLEEYVAFVKDTWEIDYVGIK